MKLFSDSVLFPPYTENEILKLHKDIRLNNLI